jgi:hypothetical protein
MDGTALRHHLFDSAGLKTMMNDDGGHYVHACTMLAPALLTATMQQHQSKSSSPGASDRAANENCRVTLLFILGWQVCAD